MPLAPPPVDVTFAPDSLNPQANYSYTVPAGFQWFSNVVLEWNTIAIDTALIDSQRPGALIVNNVRIRGREQDGPTRMSRAITIFHAALYNAVIGIEDPNPKPYGLGTTSLPKSPVPTGAPAAVQTLYRDLAAAAAARRALVLLFPSQRERLTETFSYYLRAFRQRAQELGLPTNPDPAPPIVFYGEEVARLTLRGRDGDQADITRPYRFLMEKAPDGIWRPDLIDATQQPLTPRWGLVRPFALKTSEIDSFVQGVLPRPPGGWTGQSPPFINPPNPLYDLTQPDYVNATKEVKRVGAYDAEQKGNRTPEQTLNAIFWSYDNGRGTPIRLYNQNVRAIVQQRKELTVKEYALLFLLVNIAMADAAIATWRVKYYYRLWRPIHAIRLAPAGDPLRDPNWKPLGKPRPYAVVEHCSPPFPAFTSGHSGIGAAAFAITQKFYASRDAKTYFYLTSDEIPGYWEYFSSFEAAIQANGISRIPLGVHFSFDNDNGILLGKKVAEYLGSTSRPPTAPKTGGTDGDEYDEAQNDRFESDIDLEPLPPATPAPNEANPQLTPINILGRGGIS